jgi:RNA-directed DNA polymerase
LLFLFVFSFENLHRQYLKCRRNKRNTANVLRFEVRQEEHLLDLHEALTHRTYRPGRSVCFLTQRPKLREIFAADFRDRVVHHVLVDTLERIWEPIFIHDSYACRKGKGVHAGVKRLQTFIRQATANGTRPAWYLQLDIRNYFMSIDKPVLFDLLAAKMNAPDALWLTRTLVFHDCTQDYVMKGDAGLYGKLPPHKSLFGCGPGKGLPIGNLNSQFFANVYLNGLDQFVKHTLKCRWYLRYCDDFVLLAGDRAQLVEWRDRIEGYLRDALHLELNTSRERLRPVSDGVDFLGYIVRRDYLLVRRRVVGHLRERLRQFEKALVPDGPGYRRYRFDTAVLDELNAVLASYLGHFKLADSFRLRQGLLRDFTFLGEYFGTDLASGTLKRKNKPPPGLRGVARQYRHFRRSFLGDVLFFQVGKFIEFYQPGDAIVAADLGLRRMARNRRGARYGFPLARSGGHLLSLLATGRSVTLIGESGRFGDGVKERVPRYRFESRA